MDFDLGASFLVNYASFGGIKILVFRDLECVAYFRSKRSDVG